MTAISLIVSTTGSLKAIYDESMLLESMGIPSIRRASHVEPDSEGQWIADLSPVGGPQLGPFELRSMALAAERTWLNENWLERNPDILRT